MPKKARRFKPLDLSKPGAIGALLDFHRATFGDLRMEDDGGSDDGGDAGSGGDDGGPGYPLNTPVAEMTAEQQAAYHRAQSRKWESRAKARGDYDELKAKADQFDQLTADQQTEQEKAVTAAREEGRKAAAAEANTRVAVGLYKAALSARGVNGDDLAELVAAFNPAPFLADDDVDTDRVAALASRHAGAGNGGLDMGQGRDHGGPRKTGVSAGADLFAKSRGKSTTTTS